MIVFLTITSSLLLLSSISFLRAFIVKREDGIIFKNAFLEQRDNYVKLIREIESEKKPEIKFYEDEIDPNTDVMVARWSCVGCKHPFTLNYYRSQYNLSHDKLDITGQYRSYECFKCGSNLMTMSFANIPYHTLPNPWKDKTS